MIFTNICFGIVHGGLPKTPWWYIRICWGNGLVVPLGKSLHEPWRSTWRVGWLGSVENRAALKVWKLHLTMRLLALPRIVEHSYFSLDNDCYTAADLNFVNNSSYDVIYYGVSSIPYLGMKSWDLHVSGHASVVTHLGREIKKNSAEYSNKIFYFSLCN